MGEYMDYIYANLNDKVTKVTYEGVESPTAIVYVDQDRQTIKVDLQNYLGLTPNNVFSTQVPTINPTDPAPIKEDTFVLLAYVKDGAVKEYKYVSWKQVIEDDIVKRILLLEESSDKLDKLLKGEILAPKADNANTADKAKNGLPEPTNDTNIVTNITGEWEAIKAYDIALELPNTITEITDYMFENNDIFSSVIIPSTVTTIGVGAFKNCTRLKEVIIKEGVRVISTSAFEGCNKLENVTIPSTISSIGDNAFWSGNSNKLKVTVNSTTPAELSLSSFNPGTLDYIIVPMESLDTYKTLWNTYAEFIYDTVPVSLADIEKLTTILKGTDNIVVNHIDGTRNVEISGKNKLDKSSIVQETGNSETEVMSQRAVTDEINKKSNATNLENGEGVGSIKMNKGNCTAKGAFASSSGYYTNANGGSTYAGGYYSIADVEYSMSYGISTRTQNNVLAAFGRLNNPTTGHILEVGNGSDGSRSNAFAVLSDGRAKIQSSPIEDDDAVRKLELDKKITGTFVNQQMADMLF